MTDDELCRLFAECMADEIETQLLFDSLTQEVVAMVVSAALEIVRRALVEAGMNTRHVWFENDDITEAMVLAADYARVGVPWARAATRAAIELVLIPTG